MSGCVANLFYSIVIAVASMSVKNGHLFSAIYYYYMHVR